MDFITELEKNDFLLVPLMESSMQRIMCEVYRLFHRSQTPHSTFGRKRSIDEKLVYDIVQYLEADTAHALNLS